MSSNEITTEETLETVIKSAGLVFFGIICGHFLAYLTRIIIARWLGPSDYGLISLAFIVLEVAITLSFFGMKIGITRYVSYYKARKDLSRVKGTFFSAFKIFLPLSIVVSILVFSFSGQIANFFHNKSLVPILQILSLYVPFCILFDSFIAMIRGLKATKYKLYAQDLFFPTVRILLIIPLLYIGYNLIGVAIAYVIAIFLSACIAGYYLAKIFPLFKKEIRSKFITKKLISFSWPLFFVGVLGLVMGKTDTAMLGFFKTATDVGIYNAALPTASLLTIIGSSFAFISIPVISELYSKNKMTNLKQTYKTITKWIFSLAFPLFLLLMFFPNQIMSILFGIDYLQAVYPLTILAVGYFFSTLVGPASLTITAIGKTKVNLFITAIGATSNFILNFILIPIFGIIGAAIATASSIILLNLISLIYIYSHLRVQPYDISYIKPLASSIISILIFYSFGQFFSISGWGIIFLFPPFLLFYFFLFLLMKGMDKDYLLILEIFEKKSRINLKWLRYLIKKFG